MDGVFLVNKQKDWTSFDICGFLRKRFNTKRVGHTGTLDPFATGVMIVTMGSATKIIPFLEDCDKEYVATLELGKTTDTLDLTGKVIEEKDVPTLSKEIIEEVLSSFKGEIEQVPPMYSALKKDGVPLYMLARDGIEIERKARKVTIYDISLISFTNTTIVFKARVSKGTYIRTLGSDIAEKLSTVGYLSALERTSIGKFDIAMTKDVHDIEEKDIISISEMLPHIDNIIVDEIIEKKIRNGIPLFFKGKSDLIFLKTKDNQPLAIYERVECDKYKTKRGLFICE